MVVDDLDIGRSLIGPHKADAPLAAQTHRMLSGPVALQFLEMIARRKPEILEDHGGALRIATRPGHTTVGLALPRVAASRAVAPRTEADP